MSWFPGTDLAAQQSVFILNRVEVEAIPEA